MSIPEFILVEGDVVIVKNSVKCDFRKAPIKEGRYKVVGIKIHPKADQNDISNPKSYCYYFSKVKLDGCCCNTVSFVYNCMDWDGIICQGGTVKVTFNQDKFLKELKGVLTKYEVSLSANMTYSSPWDEDSSPCIVINYGDRIYDQKVIGPVINPNTPSTPV